MISVLSDRNASIESQNSIVRPAATAISSSAGVPAKAISVAKSGNIWEPPDTSTIAAGKAGEMIRYGRELIVHTANYLGPKGSIAQITNGLNCQNCHLDAGTRLFSNNYASFIANYPKMSERSGKIDFAADRLTQCFERSMNGTAPDTTKREIQAMLAYLKWIGNGVKRGQKLFGRATSELAFMDHAADPVKGGAVYIAKCESCHGQNGEGLLAADKKSYTYPPLWGDHSYNDGAGMYSITSFAAFVKDNMPYGATYQNSQLTDEEAWDLAAFVDSQPRPHKNHQGDFPNRAEKPIDFPFGPYADRFSEKQHKYGPFNPIKDARKE